MYVYIYMYVCMYVYIYIYIYVYTYFKVDFDTLASFRPRLANEVRVNRVVVNNNCILYYNH